MSVRGMGGENKLIIDLFRCFVDHSKHSVSVQDRGKVPTSEAKLEFLGISQGSGSQRSDRDTSLLLKMLP